MRTGWKKSSCSENEPDLFGMKFNQRWCERVTFPTINSIPMLILLCVPIRFECWRSACWPLLILLLFSRKLYDKKHPERILPINCWLPLVDTSDLGPYLVIYVVQVIALMLYFTSLSYSVIQVTAFLTPLEGQFRILARYVGMLGRSPRDPLGTYVRTPIGVLCKDEGWVSNSTFYLPRRWTVCLKNGLS
jgi:hypothetical protein